MKSIFRLYYQIFFNKRDDETRYIHIICKILGIQDFKVNKDNTVTVFQDVDLAHRGLTEIPIKFHTIHGNFDCSYNRLNSLENAPLYVFGYFWCTHNNLKSLDGIYESTISGDLMCYENPFEVKPKKPNGVRYFNPGREFMPF